MLRLIIVRHGETSWNKVKRKQGHRDIPLSTTGKLQVQKLAKRLEKESIDMIYTSTLSRAKSSAKIINQYHSAPVIIDARLKEMNYGIFEGKTDHDIATIPLLKKEWENRNKDYLDYRLPNGESFNDVKRRVKSILKEILKNKNKTILIVGHGTMKRALLSILTKMNPEQLRNEFIHATAVSIVTINGKKVNPVIINCNKHLTSY